MTIFPYVNIRVFSENNQTMIKHKNLIYLSNLKFNYCMCWIVVHVPIHNNTDSVSPNITLCNTCECFPSKSCIAHG